MQYETIIFSVALVVYFSFTAVMGYIARKGSKTPSGFFLAERKLGTLATSSTLAATTIGGSATILVIGQVFSRGLPFIWTDIAGGAGLILLGIILAGKVREMNCFSLPEIIGRFFGQRVRRISAIIVTIAQIGFLSLLLRSSVSLLAPYLQLPPLMVLLVVAGIFILYTAIGGQLAVVRTDVVQLLLMVCAFVMLSIPLLFFTEINWQALPQEHLNFPVNEHFGFFSLLSLVVIAGLPHLVGSDIYGKILSARDASVARRSAIIAGFIKIAVGIVVGIIGLAAAALLPSTPPDQVLSTLLLTLLPKEAALLVIFGFIATLMSSADSVLLTAGTVITRDILQTDEGGSVRAGRISICVTGLLAIALTFFFPTILGAFLFAYTLFSSSLVVPVLAGFWKERLGLTPHGATVSMCCSASVVIILSLLGYSTEIITLSGLLTCSILLFAVSWIYKRK